MWRVVLAAGIALNVGGEWQCPQVGGEVTCRCEVAHTVSCTAPEVALPSIAAALASLHSLTLLDLNIQCLTAINTPIFEGVVLQGLAITSGELSQVGEEAFTGVSTCLEGLALPDNKLSLVPGAALRRLPNLKHLDVSHNLLKKLNNQSFTGLSMLGSLDLSGNQIRFIESSTFSSLSLLEVLRIQSNGLTVETISKLQGLLNLEELNLSFNSIAGPLRSTTLPKLPRLKILNLANNQLSSVMEGALQGLHSLRSLSLQRNMIDVLEDHAFRGLTRLNSLNLAHNRMVAVSGASLAHLSRLTQLDVSHNFLRALTSDLVSPLFNLQDLTLDDNDISMVSSNALHSASHLLHLTLANNPLNCDCSLITFVKWLHNSSISEEDKRTAVCATPPLLENGLVQELHLHELICEHGNSNPKYNRNHTMPVSSERVTLRAFSYNGKNISLLWAVNNVGEKYYCDAMFVYEELGAHEVLLESKQLQCDSNTLKDPHILPVTLEIPHLQKGHRYRYCLIMVERNQNDDSAIILGCSEVLTLSEQSSPQILSLNAEYSNPQILSINAQIWPPKHQNCSLEYVIYGLPEVVKLSQPNCSVSKIKIKGVKDSIAYKVCAFFIGTTPHCIWTPVATKSNSYYHPTISFVFIFLAIFILVIITTFIYCWMRKTVDQPKLHEQCFLPTHQNVQHSRYVKLQVTTKV